VSVAERHSKTWPPKSPWCISNEHSELPLYPDIAIQILSKQVSKLKTEHPHLQYCLYRMHEVRPFIIKEIVNYQLFRLCCATHSTCNLSFHPHNYTILENKKDHKRYLNWTAF
jgi:hypothetical protein